MIRLAQHTIVRLTVLVVGGALACSGDGPVTPPPAIASCDGVQTAVLTLAPLEATVVDQTAQVACVVLAGNADYLVVPQLTGASLPYGGYGFRIGDPDAVPPVALRDEVALTDPTAGTESAQRSLDSRLRRDEQQLARGRGARARAMASAMASALPDPGSVREFSVLSSLDATPAYARVGAALRVVGTRVLLYVDTLAADAFSEAELAAAGALYDGALAPAVFDAFGGGSDIDANGRVIFLLTPTVNALVTAAQCPVSGFVRGFFYGHDLASDATTSNRGEVFYGFVPDPTGRWSCAHAKAEVTANLPPTFMHELQHMISYGEHVIERGGAPEEVWLNEGLSHVAEELGSLHYEARYPAPTGRTNPAQILPDSSSPFLTPNLLYSNRFLVSSAFYSLTSCAPGSFCSLAERGATWLWLRWIADQGSAGLWRRLVETARTGRNNLEAATGESTAALLGDFALAVSADSIVGVPRSAVPARYRFTTRNLRQLYRALFEAYGLPGGVGRPFPIEPLTLPAGGAVTGTMRPGTFATYRLSVGATTPVVRLRFAVPDGSPFPASAGAQLSVMRLPR